MTTPRTRTVVSLATAALIASLALGGCARASSGPAADRPALTEPRRATVRFDNEALDPVDVYLLVDQREWRLGRVPPGGRANLRIPEASFAGGTSFVQIAVLAGGDRTPLAAPGGRMTLSVPQPAPEIFSQRWKFADGHVRSVQLRAARMDVGRP